MTTHFRKHLDKVLQGMIKLCMLTGVTFMVTACYGPMPNRPEKELEETMDMEQRLADSLETPQEAE